MLKQIKIVAFWSMCGWKQRVVILTKSDFLQIALINSLFSIKNLYIVIFR